MPDEDEEKRSAPRVPVDFDVRFAFENKEYIAHALNLSPDGMFVKTDYMLLQNDVIEIYFHLPEVAEPLWMKARVAWASRVDPEKPTLNGMGVQFIDPLPAQKADLERYLQQLLKS